VGGSRSALQSPKGPVTERNCVLIGGHSATEVSENENKQKPRPESRSINSGGEKGKTYESGGLI